MQQISENTAPALCVMTEDRLRLIIGEVVRDALKEKDESKTTVLHSYNKDEYITANETSEMLQVDLSTLWRWSKTGMLTRYHMGPRQVRYKLSEVKAFIEKSNRKTGNQHE